MSYHDPHNAEIQLYALVHRGQWTQALNTLDEWLAREPWRTELLLRKAQVLRALKRFEVGLSVIREYRAQKPSAGDVAFQELDFLLDLHRTTEALEVLALLPAEQRQSPQAEYYRGRILLARREREEGLRALWTAYQREPGLNRALVEWAVVAGHQYGKWRVRRQLRSLLSRHGDNPTIAISVGLALASIDARSSHRILRYAVDRYPDVAPSMVRRAPYATPPPGEMEDTYREASERILSGHCDAALDAYYQAVAKSPGLVPALAPLVSDILLDKLVRPEEARVVLEEALRQAPADYRLQSSYTRVFLHLGFGEEALSAANCALALAPESERPAVLVRRAGALVLLKERDRAIRDLTEAVGQLPDIRSLIHIDTIFAPLARDPRFRSLMTERMTPPDNSWNRLWLWLTQR